MKKFLFCHVFLLFIVSNIFAESSNIGRNISSNINPNSNREITWKDDALVPFTTSGKYAFYPGLALAGTLKLFFTDSVINEVRDRARAHNSLGVWDERIDLMGQLIPNAIYAGGMGLYGYLGEKNNGYKNSMIMIKSSFYACMMTTILKHTIRERRPSNGARNSFPSGHSTSAFAFASVIGANHEWYYGVPAYALATLIGFQRLNSGVHFLHDVIAGASIGMAYGLGISELYKGKKESAVWFPTLPSDGTGLAINYLTTF